MGSLGLVELVLDLADVLGGDSALGEVDVALLFVHAQHERDLLPAHIDLPGTLVSGCRRLEWNGGCSPVS